ncbi:Ig-like domain-containing protein [Thalassotalea fonticola]|uniref:Ig-like domain-containing protein n=1 Tax=Thalassotalea fonticola TaxID=3065649 RepID=A0ABZ0GL34_9GAMM|nr:Ig-like domain-containing protein [Colwelliaceae bacterium S1-1]
MMTKRITAKPSKIALAIASLYLTGAATAHAATVVTDMVNSGDTCNWSDNACWHGGVAPSADNADNIGILGNDIVTFDLASPLSIGPLDVGSKTGKIDGNFPEHAGVSGELIIPAAANLTMQQINVSYAGTAAIPGDVTYDSAGNELTRATSKINQTGGAVKVNATLTTNVKKGTVVVTKGSLTLGGNGINIDTDADTVADTFVVTSDGQYNISSGSLALTSGQSTLRSGGTLNVSGDAIVNLLAMRSAGGIQISGSDATVNFAGLKVAAVEGGNYPEASIQFNLSETGISPIAISAKSLADIQQDSGLDFSELTTPFDPTTHDGNAAICNSNITVDGSSYTGGAVTLPLITADAFIANSVCDVKDGVVIDPEAEIDLANYKVEPKSISITGFDENSYVVSTTQTTTALTLNITPNAPTIVSFASPLAQAELNVDEQVSLSVEVTDADGIEDVTKVEFFDGETLISAATLQGDNLTFSADWTPTIAEFGERTIYAVATDSKGSTTTQTITVNVVDNNAADEDGDGVPDELDKFPTDISASVDSDDDGYPDEYNDDCDQTCQDSSTLTIDAFPEDETENTDTDADGTGDNSDYYPTDPEKWQDDVTDSDGDNTPDLYDEFPSDPNESVDTDGDGTGDNADAFPEDETEDTDTDGDGVGDNSDDYPEDPSKSKNLRGDNPKDFAVTEALAEAYAIPADVTSVNIAKDVVIDCQRPDDTNLPCISGGADVLSSLYILNEGSIEVTDGDDRTAARAINLDSATGLTIYGLTNSGVNSKIRSNDSAIRLDNVTVTNGIVNQGLISTGHTSNKITYIRSGIEITSSDGSFTSVIGGITNSGTIEYLDEKGGTIAGYSIRLGHESKENYTHSVDFIDNSGTITGDLSTAMGATIDSITNSGTINGHVGTLKSTQGKAAKKVYVIDNHGNATSPIGDPIEDYVDAYYPSVTINSVTNSGVISGVLAFGADTGGTYTTNGGTVGSIRHTSSIIVEGTAQTTSTINSDLDFAGELTFNVTNSSVAAKDVSDTPMLAINGNANLADSTLVINPTGAAFAEGTGFTLLSVNSTDGGNTPGTLLEQFSAKIIEAGGTYFEITLSEDGTALIATSIDGKDTDGDGVPDAADYYPDDNSKWEDDVTDTDSDGTPDLYDAFPQDAAETKDSDGDEVGDNADYYPNDASKWQDDVTDTDGDGTPDLFDTFPQDATETIDSDEDGVGDNADKFPFDSTRTEKTDTSSGSFGYLLGLLAFIRVFARKK